jgi:hypothetical protein
LQERFGHTAFLETDFENLQAYQLAKNWQQWCTRITGIWWLFVASQDS